MRNLFHYERWLRSLLYPAFNRVAGRDIFGALAERELTGGLSPLDLREMQFRKLRAILTNAAERVPYYRRRFREIGFEPARLKSLEAFAELQFSIDKAEVREQTEDFIADGCDRRRLTWHRSGGSTGTPLVFATDPATNAASPASLVRCLRWWGTDIGAPHAQFWGSPRFIIRSPLDRLRKHTLGIRNWLMNRMFIPNYDLSDVNMSAIRERIERFRPGYVRGMASSLFIFSRFLLAKGSELQQGRPKVVLSACEQLYDWEREAIEKGFGAPVANTYGLSEFGDWGFEAPCGRMHLSDEDVLTELLPLGDGSGQLEIVATQLNNMMTPLIRYRTGDVAERVSAGCDCGRGLQVLEGLHGRAHDFIVSPDGKFVHGQFFTHLVVFEAGIVKYQVVQEEVGLFRVILVVDGNYSRVSEERIRRGAVGYLGPEARMVFEYVPAIPLSAVGKHRWIISKVAGGRMEARPPADARRAGARTDAEAR